MSLERIRQTVSKSVPLKVLLSVFLITLLIFYFKIFFTTGVNFEDTFLTKEVTSSGSYYTGESIHGRIQITVKGVKNKHESADVIYKLPNNINKQYTVSFKDPGNWDSGITNIKDEAGNIVFEGEYRKDSYFLIDKNGKSLFDDSIRILVNGESPFNADYKVSLKNVADFAFFTNDTVRGRYDFLLLAVFLFILTAIDMKFPLFFFNLRNILYVKDPEPSDLYIALQRISWVVYPGIGIILMLIAILM